MVEKDSSLAESKNRLNMKMESSLAENENQFKPC